ncbi:RHS repeat domain-containing protein [Rubinisphaera margarita]|uniref:RHS repeat domain-containing protein n=1 Tax=Rubinisphaera margarita TaxID=2909586 RepID=UPI001EE7E8C8|nr:RHS repeat-associated core domain-containing protein [Rubinisphaera margarita]MCG6154364.1 hypothetical protein [Rubinisphaera margarita]
MNSPFGSGFVIADSPEPEVKWTLVDLTGTNDPDTGDIYLGWDRFGRIKDCRWYNYNTASDVDRIKYGYDRVSNRIWRQNVVAESLDKHFDELYSYDALHRLKDLQRGTLNSQKDGITDKTFAECWSLDPTGNWKKYLQDSNGDGSWDLNQSRTNNEVNEITGIAASVGVDWPSPGYDHNGNMIRIPNAKASGLDWAQFTSDEWKAFTTEEWEGFEATGTYTATYDAWDHLVKIDDQSASVVIQYEFDGARRRCAEQKLEHGVSQSIRHIYYTDPKKWQVAEERIGNSTNAERQFVWGMRYIDDVVVRDRDVGGVNQRLYGLQDANWNTNALCSHDGVIQQRVTYSAYGVPTFLSPMFEESDSPSYEWQYLYAGYRSEVDMMLLYYVRNRSYICSLGVWSSRDDVRYRDSLSLYLYVGDSPLVGVDPSGNELKHKDKCLEKYPYPDAGKAGDGIAECMAENCPQARTSREIRECVNDCLGGASADAIKEWFAELLCCSANSTSPRPDPCGCGLEFNEKTNKCDTPGPCRNPLDDSSGFHGNIDVCQGCCEFLACVDAFQSLGGGWADIMRDVIEGTFNKTRCDTSCI